MKCRHKDKKLEEKKIFIKLKDKKGFTLVELIVVLVILAILAALLIPALTGYIDKANYEKVIATTRTVVMAAQTETSEAYGKGNLPAAGLSASELTETDMGKNIGKLAEILNTKGDGYVNGITSAKVTVTVANGHVTTVEVKQGGYTCTYTKDSVPTTGDYIVGNYTVSKDKK